MTSEDRNRKFPETPAVAARGLVRKFGRVRALRGLDLDVARGSTLALFGANGSGKTTLLRILGGLTAPGEGSVVVLGKALPATSSLRSRIGMLGHESMLYADLTARENLEHYARLYGVGDNKGRAREMLALARLSDAAERPVRGFSRGMLQRLAVARTILHDPELVLLDEPFTGLDQEGTQILEEIIAEQRLRKRTVILTTHDFARGLAVADAATIIHRGRAVWSARENLPDPAQFARTYTDATTTHQ